MIMRRRAFLRLSPSPPARAESVIAGSLAAIMAWPIMIIISDPTRRVTGSLSDPIMMIRQRPAADSDSARADRDPGWTPRAQAASEPGPAAQLWHPSLPG